MTPSNSNNFSRAHLYQGSPHGGACHRQQKSPTWQRFPALPRAIIRNNQNNSQASIRKRIEGEVYHILIKCTLAIYWFFGVCRGGTLEVYLLDRV